MNFLRNANRRRIVRSLVATVHQSNGVALLLTPCDHFRRRALRTMLSHRALKIDRHIDDGRFHADVWPNRFQEPQGPLVLKHPLHRGSMALVSRFTRNEITAEQRLRPHQNGRIRVANHRVQRVTVSLAATVSALHTIDGYGSLAVEKPRQVRDIFTSQCGYRRRVALTRFSHFDSLAADHHEGHSGQGVETRALARVAAEQLVSFIIPGLPRMTRVDARAVAHQDLAARSRYPLPFFTRVADEVAAL